MKKIVITGGSGFIGTNLIEKLHKNGFDIVNFDIRIPQNEKQIKFFRYIDILEFKRLVNAIKKFNPDYMIHLAARTDLNGRSLDDYSVNTVGTKNIIKAISTFCSVKRCIFTTSKLVCRPEYVPKNAEDYAPHTLYGESKVISENIIRNSNLSCTWCIGRPSSIWGPWFGVPYRDFFINIAKGRYWHPGGINPPKSFGYVGNVVHQILSLIYAPHEKVNGNTFYWSDYEHIFLKEWADCISLKTRGKVNLEVHENFLKTLSLGGDIMKKIGVKNPPLTSFRLKNIKADTTGIPLDSMKDISGPLPFTVDQGVDETLTWLKDKKFIK